ncbi:hypothetical protein KUCAC02_037790, partial [Chaenocephalus aceratus]
ATSQPDLETWVTALHSASAALHSRRGGGATLRRGGVTLRGGGATLQLLRLQSQELLENIEKDGRMKKMAELQLSVIREANSRRAVQNQIQQWDQNLEQLNLDLFRFRCYQSSLQGDEPPNPKNLLAVATRPSKCMLGRLGVFSVNSFHALVCSRGQLPDTTKGRTSTSTSTQGPSGSLSLHSAEDFVLLPVCDDELQRESVERVHALYQTFPECRAAEPDVPRNPYLSPPHLSPAHLSPPHLSPPQRLRKVIQELVDTEKSYVKDLECLFDLYLTPLQTQSFLSKEESEEAFRGRGSSDNSVLEVKRRSGAVVLLITVCSSEEAFRGRGSSGNSVLERRGVQGRGSSGGGSVRVPPEMLDFQRGGRRRWRRKARLPNLEAPEQRNCSRRSAGRSCSTPIALSTTAASAPITRRLQKVLERAKTDAAFKHFLETRNPTKSALSVSGVVPD